MLTGFDAPPLHTLYLDRPLKGALLMQTLARVNRTFRGKPDGLLVAYAPLAENLEKALAEYTESDRTTKPVGRDVDEAAVVTRTLVEQLDALCAGFGWRAKLKAATPRSGSRPRPRSPTSCARPRRRATRCDDGDEPSPSGSGSASWSPSSPGAWAVASGRETLADLWPRVQFYEEVRVCMAKFDAAERQAARRAGARGDPATAVRPRGDLHDDRRGRSTSTKPPGMPKPSLIGPEPDVPATGAQAENPHLAIEALRDLLTAESATVTRNNVVRQRAFSERIKELMNRYTNQQLTSAEVIAELIELAKEVAAEGNRGQRFAPPLNDDELAFYDAVSTNDSAVELQGEDVLAQIARELVAVMRRDVRTDWMVRDDVRAKLRSSIKRLLVKYKYPPDKQPGAIRLVMEQMEAMAPRYAA